MKLIYVTNKIFSITYLIGIIILFIGCTKATNNDNVGSGSGGGTATGQAIFYTSSNLGCGNITVVCNGISKVITDFNNPTPTCGATNAATFTLDAGTYSFTASCIGTTWAGTIIVTAGGCFTMQLLPAGGSIQVVTICSQTWMVKNLNVSTYRNGNSIPQVTDPAAWAALTTGAWCYYNNDPAKGAIYGKLYNWYAVNDPRGLAPVGWHIPTDAEWTTLSNCLGGDPVAGGKMRESSTTFWASPNFGATNSSGFTGLPGGFRSYVGNFTDIPYQAYWWSSTTAGIYSSWYRNIFYNTTDLYRNTGERKDGISVRCIKD